MTDGEVGDPVEAHGRVAIRARAAALRAAFPDFRLERFALVIDGASHADRLTGLAGLMRQLGQPRTIDRPAPAGSCSP